MDNWQIFLAVSAIGNFLLLADKLRGKTEKREISPNPLTVTKKEEFVDRASYYKHCELNREEHQRLERTQTDMFSRISQEIHLLSREVSEIRVARENNGETLKMIATQLADVAAEVNRLFGVVHQMSKPPVKAL